MAGCLGVLRQHEQKEHDPAQASLPALCSCPALGPCSAPDRVSSPPLSSWLLALHAAELTFVAKHTTHICSLFF